MSEKNLVTLFHRQAYRFWDRGFILHRPKSFAEWREASWQQVADRVKALGRALLAADVKPNDRVLVLDSKGISSLCGYLAALSVRSVAVPMEIGRSPEAAADLLKGLNTSTVLIPDDLDAAMLQPLAKCFQTMTLVLERGTNEPGITSRRIFADQTSGIPSAESFFQRLSEVGTDEPATFVPRRSGVPTREVFTHSQLLLGARSFADTFRMTEDDLVLSDLPFSSSLGALNGLFSVMLRGARLARTNATPPLDTSLGSLRPTIIVWPREVFSAYYDRIRHDMEKRSGLVRYLFARATEKTEGSPRGMYDHLFFKRIRKELGGQVRSVVCLGEPLESSLRGFFERTGIPLEKDLPSNCDFGPASEIERTPQPTS